MARTKQTPLSEDKDKERKLRRDLGGKMLGGVAAGLGRYWHIDPLWIRLLFLFLSLGTILSKAYGSTFGALSLFLYVALWIFVPGIYFLERHGGKYKKFYRDPQRKVFGGVASGLATYFDIDLILVRVLFVASMLFAGAGLVLYLLLWLLAPKAPIYTRHHTKR